MHQHLWVALHERRRRDRAEIREKCEGKAEKADGSSEPNHYACFRTGGVWVLAVLGYFTVAFCGQSEALCDPLVTCPPPLCHGHLMCRLMSCFTVPTVWHLHTFFISVNCSYLISDRDVNIHLQWSDHSWSAKIDCHLHLVVVCISNVSPLTARDHILTNGGSYFRCQKLPFKGLVSLKKLLLFGKINEDLHFYKHFSTIFIFWTFYS